MAAFFFGHPVHQFYAFLLVTASLSCGFYWGFLRNIKRDPELLRGLFALASFLASASISIFFCWHSSGGNGEAPLTLNRFCSP